MLVLALFPLGAIWAFARRRDLATAVRRRHSFQRQFGFQRRDSAAAVRAVPISAAGSFGCAHPMVN